MPVSLADPRQGLVQSGFESTDLALIALIPEINVHTVGWCRVSQPVSVEGKESVRLFISLFLSFLLYAAGFRLIETSFSPHCFVRNGREFFES